MRRMRVQQTELKPDLCPQCGRANVRTRIEIKRGYVCHTCTTINES